MVLGVGETAQGIVALTVQGGKNQCDGEESPLTCWTLAPPLQAWTSSDASSWVAHPGPDIDLRDEGGVEIQPPIFKAGTQGLIVLDWEENGSRPAVSQDGVTWDVLPAGQFSTQIGFRDNNVAAFGSGFVAVSEDNDRDTVKAVALTSSDGRTWRSQPLPRKGFASGWIPAAYGTSASGLVAGSDGLIATGTVASAPGAELWWSSLDGRTWKPLPRFPPLGIWKGQGEGSGILADGVLVGNGERMLAYRSAGRDAGWTSADGRTWHRLSIAGQAPPATSRIPPIVLPMGVLWVAEDGSTWFGEPSS
jgi:hypothetical protein